MRHIGEGRLAVPESWHDNSVNIYREHSEKTPGLSITISRDRLPENTPFQDYVAAQLNKLRQTLTEFRMAEERPLEIDRRPAYLCEFSWRTSETDLVHQLLVSIANGSHLLNLTVSNTGPMSSSTRTEMRAALLSFQFAPPACS